MLPYRKTAWVCQHKRCSAEAETMGVTMCCSLCLSHSSLLDMALFWVKNTKRTVCSGNTMHLAKAAKPQIVRWTISTFFWPQLSTELRTGKCRDEFWSKLLLTFLSHIAKNQTTSGSADQCVNSYISCLSSHPQSGLQCLLSGYAQQHDPFSSLSTELLSQHLPTSVAPPAPISTGWDCFPGPGFSNIRLYLQINCMSDNLKKGKVFLLKLDTLLPPTRAPITLSCLKEIWSHFFHQTPASSLQQSLVASASSRPFWLCPERSIRFWIQPICVLNWSFKKTANELLWQIPTLSALCNLNLLS